MTTASGAGVSGGTLKPLGIGETLDAAIKLYRNNAVDLWKMVALVIVPIQVIEVIIRRITLPGDVFLQSGTLYTHNLTGSGSTGGTVALLLVALLGLLGQLLATGAVFKLQLDAYLGRPHDISESFEFAGKRLLSLLWLGILSTILVAIGFVLIIIPGIWLLVAISVAAPALMLEGVKGFGAMKRSMQLVKGRWWATFGRLFAAFLLYGIVIAIFGAIGGAIANGVTNVTLYLALNGLVSAIGVILLSPFIAAVINVMYIDLRVRKEALDIELLASHFGGPGSGQPATTAVAPAATPDTGLPGESGSIAVADHPMSQPPSSGPTWPPAG